MRPIAAPASASTSPAAVPPPTADSPWHSPVPYLFGGLAAMLGLIALALLILACSYWKLNDYLGAADGSSPGAGGAADVDGSKSPAAGAAASPRAFAGLVAVVMAGQNMPTFLAAPIVRRPGTGTDGEGSSELRQGGASAATAAGGERSQRVDQV